MASHYEKSVKGATKSKAAPPKSKYIEHILTATDHGEHGVSEVFRSLQPRIQDSTWTVVLKSLITVHLMIREGSPDVTLSYLARHTNKLFTSNFTDVQFQGLTIRHYVGYLCERAKAFRETKCDFVRGAASKLERLTVDKGLLRETEIVQHQITALLKCDVFGHEPENEITITVFRMLVLDLLALFHAMNAGLINILGHFFEMSKIDAMRALDIYKVFTHQTILVVQYLSIARQYEYHTRVEVPKLKHAPTDVGKQLEDYVMDADFEANRKQYLAELESKNGTIKTGGGSKNALSKRGLQARAIASNSFPEPKSATTALPAKGPDPDLIDFFESIEQNQQPLATQPGLQQQSALQFNGSAQFLIQENQLLQQNHFPSLQKPFQNFSQYQQSLNTGLAGHQGSLDIQTHYTSAASTIGEYPPSQSNFQAIALPMIPQETAIGFQQQPPHQLITVQSSNLQTTNPFRQSTRYTSPTENTGTSFNTPSHVISPHNRQSTNPFAKSAILPTQILSAPPNPGLQQSQLQPFPSSGPALGTATGTNPFAISKRVNDVNLSQLPQQTGVISHSLVNTNPFRQTASIGTNSWQKNQNIIDGGIDGLETVSVFPRPVQQLAWN